DDFGVSRTAIEWKVHRSLTFSADTTSGRFEVPLPYMGRPSIEFAYVLNLSEINLAPDDAVEYFAVVYDNDTFSGPKRSVSRSYFARFPSLEEMFAEIDEGMSNVDETIEETIEAARELSESLREMSEELKRDPEVDWQTQKEMEEALEKQKELQERLDEINRELEEIIKESESNNLFTEETLRMYSELQQLFDDLATPELLEAMEKLAEAAASLNEDAMRKALDEFRLNQEQFAKNLERTLDIFKRVQIEQKMDEVVKRLEELAETQTEIADKAADQDPDDSSGLENLALEENAALKELEAISRETEKLSELTREYLTMPSDEISEMAGEMSEGEAQQKMNEARRSMSQGNRQQSAESARRSEESLKQMLESMQSLRSSMKSAQMEEVLSDFRRIAGKSLELSKMQESLHDEGEDLPVNSPQLSDIASKQEQLRRGLSSIIQDLVELSKKTFGVSPQTARAIGATSGAMAEAIRQMEERDGKSATRSQKAALGGLNETNLTIR
ncbi:MAG: hypothetical protein KAI64_07510, partial [Thermoplasmata archaeon]|nr:hypothetical protein [Thermoplasmata archaeon]